MHLHWLAGEKRIQFKILVLVHTAMYSTKARHCVSHRCSIIIHHAGPIRSDSALLFDVPRVHLQRFGRRRACICTGPTFWNSLPLEVRSVENIDQFGFFFKLIPPEYLSPIHTVIFGVCICLRIILISSQCCFQCCFTILYLMYINED